MNFKHIVTGATAALMTATPALAGNTMDDHELLWNTLQQAGVTVVTNAADCNDDSFGYYHRRDVMVAVCQDNGYPGGPQVAWTDNDLDTLRHEAQHVIQDCMVGGLGDMRSDTYFTRDDLVTFLAKSSLTQENIENIIKSYADAGASEEVIIMELEAFSVAADIDASSIAGAVRKFCF
jgi:hypothetical protein